MRFKADSVPMNDAIELGSLEIRKLFKDLNPTALDKKVNVDYLEKELGLGRFFPQSLLETHKVITYNLSVMTTNSCLLIATGTQEINQILP